MLMERKVGVNWEKKRKKQLVRNISKEMEKIAEERRTGVGNIAASILARL